MYFFFRNTNQKSHLHQWKPTPNEPVLLKVGILVHKNCQKVSFKRWIARRATYTGILKNYKLNTKLTQK